MLSRREVKQQVSAMQRDIRLMVQESSSSPREMLPSLRELAHQYGISHSLAAQSLKTLIEEGVVYSVPRVGTFVGRRPSNGKGIYLLQASSSYDVEHHTTLRIGFEERIAQLGGTSLTLSWEKALQWQESGRIPKVAGIFHFDEMESEQPFRLAPNVRRIKFRVTGEDDHNVDLVDFDNVKGGQLAAHHLLDQGHTRIAYLSLHGNDNNIGVFTWSHEREIGWRMALENAGLPTEGLVYRPTKTPSTHLQTDESHREQKQAVKLAADELIKDDTITAVVVVNSLATEGLFAALNQAKVPGAKWPAVVCFDSDEVEGRDEAAHVTALRLPWEDVGRAAADLLWERSNGQIQEPHVKRLVPMKLITRLTSSSSWPAMAENFEERVTA
jgi:DNA-binding LacI/PurR family transcriptional regulator